MPAVQAVEAELAAGGQIIIDGATGTELERNGADMHERAWCAMATATHPDMLRTVHERYIQAGARLITANTFSSNRNMLEPAGLGERFGELNRRAVEIAIEARERCDATDRVIVAASISHQIPIEKGTDQRIVSRAVPAPAVARARFIELAELLADSGAEMLLLEMMSDPELANPALEAATATGLPVWLGYSVRRSPDGQLRAYSRPDLRAQEMFEAIPAGDAQVAGIMHSSAHATTEALAELRKHWSGTTMAYPDSGYFTMPNWHFEDVMPPHEFVTCCQRWLASDVQIVGGCCGLGIEHIEALSAAMNTVATKDQGA